jgi:hypothetical protein
MKICICEAIEPESTLVAFFADACKIVSFFQKLKKKLLLAFFYINAEHSYKLFKNDLKFINNLINLEYFKLIFNQFQNNKMTILRFH